MHRNHSLWSTQAGLTWYNTIVTAVAVLYVGIFDRDLPPQFVERSVSPVLSESMFRLLVRIVQIRSLWCIAFVCRYPELYRRGVDHGHFTTWIFWRWQLEVMAGWRHGNGF